MGFIESILVDSLNGFAVNQIPVFLFQILVAGLGAHIFQLILNRKTSSDSVNYAAFMAIAVVVLTAVSKNSLPIAVLAAAAIYLFLRNNTTDKIGLLGTFIAVGWGIGCGSGSVILTLIGFAVLGILFLLVPLKK